ncbi:MAG: cation transporter [Alphaproteobacteria bacterium]|nr:cation transporter [Alphaproteobacteria bacterium]
MHEHHHHAEVSSKTVGLLFLSFIINMLLSVVEIIGGIISGSVALIGDALHNTSDAFSILVAVLAFKIGAKRANSKYTYGFRRAEVIGGFINLILLFISGCYLAVEGVGRLISPQQIDGKMIIVISVLALVIDALTAKISHHGAHHNHNMKMVFVHNLADAFGSLGVIVSGICVLLWGVYRIDGIIALVIAAYMIWQAIASFKPIVNILMNAAPESIDLEEVKKSIAKIKGVKDVHHLHLWCIDEHETALECHVISEDMTVAQKIAKKLDEKFAIEHCNVQVETKEKCCKCSCCDN